VNKLLFKRIDFWLQLVLFSVFLVSTIIFILDFSGSISNSISFTTFFAIGFLQVCSAIINFFKIKIQNKNRKSWQIVSFSLLFLIIIALILFNPLQSNAYISNNYKFISSLTYFLYFASFFATILAIWYLVITWFELKEMERQVETLTKK